MINSIVTSKPYRRLVGFINRLMPKTLARMRFRKLFGKRLNLDNPQDLNEKILWLSLCSDTSEWVSLADKYAVRKYVSDRGLGNILVKLYGRWNDAKDINWSMLPNQFVMKTNNGCGTVLIVKDKSELNIPTTIAMLNDWLAQDISNETAEFHYRHIKPCIIAEELLIPSEDDNKISTTIIDYKIWCFNGKVDSFLICSNRRDDGCDLSVYDADWNYHPEYSVFDKIHTERDVPIPRPAKLKEMIIIAEKLSAGFPEVRVDLYYNNNNIYFGELTFTSFGGTMTYYTHDALLRMGQKIDLSQVKPQRG